MEKKVKIPMYYILTENKELLGTDDHLLWGMQFEDEENRRVGYTDIDTTTHVSTVFVGIDMTYGIKREQEHEPVVFESMIFSDNQDINMYQERYTTWEQALEGHKRLVAFLENGINPGEARKTLTLKLKKCADSSSETYTENTTT